MSSQRERFFLLIVVNLLLTGVVVAGALTVFNPAPTTSGPTDTAGLEAAIERIEGRLEVFERRAQERELALVNRIAELERSLRAAPGKPEVLDPTDPAAGGQAAAAAAPSPAEALAMGLGEMIKNQAKRQRDEYIAELLNPTERGQRRQDRMLERIAGDMATRLKLEEGQKAEVERILKEVDERRRQKFRDLVLSKQSPEDVTYEEVKAVMDESYLEEDRLIEQTLPADKSEDYKESAQPFRQMIDFGAKSAFPPAEGSNR